MIPICIMLTAFSTFLPLASWALPDQADENAALFDTSETDEIANKIIRKELEFLRFNTRFRIETSNQSKWRGVREFLYNAGASGVSLAGATTVTSTRWKSHTPEKSNLIAASTCLLTGQSIIASGILLEKTLDILTNRRIKRDGFDYKTSISYCHALHEDINTLLEKRTTISREPGISREQATLIIKENRILQDLRDLALLELATFYSIAKARDWSRNTSYINGLIATGTGGGMGSLLGLLAVTTGNKHFAIPSGIGFVISGSTVIASPMINRFVTVKSRKHARKELENEIASLKDCCLATLAGDVTDLRRSMMMMEANKRSPSFLARLDIYEKEIELLEEQAKRNIQRDQENKDVFLYRQAANTAMGGTKLAWGSMLIHAGSKYSNSPRRFNRLIAQAGTVYTVSQSAWVLDTLYSAKKPKSFKFPIGGQLSFPLRTLGQRLESLEALESELVPASSHKPR